MQVILLLFKKLLFINFLGIRDVLNISGMCKNIFGGVHPLENPPVFSNFSCDQYF